jgi:hypothetical protein
MSDPDRAVGHFVSHATATPSPDEKTLATSRQRILDRLRELQGSLLARGASDDADTVGNFVVLLESIDATRPLGTKKPANLLRKASLEGKYSRLQHAIYAPNDGTIYQPYQDFGYWNGGFYAGVSNLQPGYWVYVHPRWYVWKDGPLPVAVAR